MSSSTPKSKCNNLLSPPGVMHSLSTKGEKEEALTLAIRFLKTSDFSLKHGGVEWYLWGVRKTTYCKEPGVLLSWWAGVTSARCQPQRLTASAITESNPCNHSLFSALITLYAGFGPCNTRNTLTNGSKSPQSPLKWGRAWSTSPLRSGPVSWACLNLRK